MLYKFINPFPFLIFWKFFTMQMTHPSMCAYCKERHLLVQYQYMLECERYFLFVRSSQMTQMTHMGFFPFSFSLKVYFFLPCNLYGRFPMVLVFFVSLSLFNFFLTYVCEETLPSLNKERKYFKETNISIVHCKKFRRYKNGKKVLVFAINHKSCFLRL